MALIDNLISYYKFDENAANTDVEDSHGANTATATTNTNNLYDINGRINSCFDFDGSTYVAEDSGNLDWIGSASQDFTVNIWIKDNGVEGIAVLDKRSTVGNTPIFLRIDPYGANAGYPQWSWEFSGATQLINPITVDDNNWHMITMVRDTSANEIILYVDGGNPVSTTITGTINNPTTQRFIVGGDRSGGGYVGLIDEVAIFDADIGSSGVSKLWADGAGFPYPFAVGTNMKINIADVHKDVDAIKINIGDLWKNVVHIWQNIGDAWKVVY